MTRLFSSCLAAALATIFLTAQATAGPHLLPRLPKINLGKAVGAAAYPVTKGLVNGGTTVPKTAATAETLGCCRASGRRA